uniref:Reverse transcriptase Ty1/copia-type domain-containing protein n=1 Tax=Fagus sylvatica TaxID=28930 RepID=A0A2N9GXV9_FAGSY
MKKAGPPRCPVVHGELPSGPRWITQRSTPNSVTKRSAAAAPAAADDGGDDISWSFPLSTGRGGLRHRMIHGITSWKQKQQLKAEKTREVCHSHQDNHHSRATTTTAQHYGGPCSSTSWNLGSTVVDQRALEGNAPSATKWSTTLGVEFWAQHPRTQTQPVFSPSVDRHVAHPVQFHLGVLDLDIALHEFKKSPIPTDTSSAEENDLYKAWEKSNRLSIMFMRMTIAKNIKTTLPKIDDAKEFLANVVECFKTGDKSLVGTLMAKLTTMKFNGTHGIQEHVLEMTNLAAQLKTLGMNVDEFFLMQFILNSLPPQYGPFQINYNTMKDKWNLNQLANMLNQEEARLKQFEQHSVHLGFLSIQTISPNENFMLMGNQVRASIEAIGSSKDPISFSQALENVDSTKWMNAMKDELKSMNQNEVWDLVELPEGYKKVGCKWVFKTKSESKGNIERFKARLVAKGFTQKRGIDYKETFSPVSKNDSLRIIMALVAHYDLELHQMDVKTAFLNGSLEEEVYMDQPKGFSIEGKEHLACKLKKSIYRLKQASRQWYLKFNDTCDAPKSDKCMCAESHIGHILGQTGLY